MHLEKARKKLGLNRSFLSLDPFGAQWSAYVRFSADDIRYQYTFFYREASFYL